MDSPRRLSPETRCKKDVGRIAVIITTCNRSEHLRKCIASLQMQTVLPDEIVIADDGSTAEHVTVIEEIIRTSPLNLIYARQDHNIFMAAANRNNGVFRSSGDYLLFFDGDLVLARDVLARHIEASGRRFWITGNAVRLTADETACLSAELIRSAAVEEFWTRLERSRTGKMREVRRRFTRRALLARFLPAEKRFRRIRLASCNCSMYRSAFEAVNGFDENFRGWGWEDQDLGLRLQLAGFRGRNLAHTARALHMYHVPEPPSGEQTTGIEPNRLYHHRPRDGAYRCQNGLDKRMQVAKD